MTLATHASTPTHAGSYDILIVDDDAEMRAYIRRCLHRYDGGTHRFYEAADGLEALAQLKSCPFDLVITDVVMPRMDGLALCQTLRARCPATPVLLISGEVPTEARQQALLHDADGALAKPFNARKLRGALDHLLHSG